MKMLAVSITVITLAFSVAAQTPFSDQMDLFDTALAKVDLTRADVCFDQDEMALWGGDLWRLNYFTLFHRHPFRLPRHGELNLEALQTDVGNPPALVAKAGKLIDCPVFRGLIGDPLENYVVFDDTIPKPSITRRKNVLTGVQYAALKDGIDLIYALADDQKAFFKRGLDKADNNKYRERLFDYFIHDNEEYHDLVYELVEKIDFNRMVAGAQDIAEAVRRVADSGHLFVFPQAKTEIKTRKGLIVIGSPGNDVYDYYNPPLLIIDGSGDDTYRFSGYPDKYPLAVIIDLTGNDHYISADTLSPGIAGAVIGMSILIDRQGNDRYEGRHFSQGAGLFGVGVLCDASGDDIYTANTFSQGAGAFGIGILADSSGNDSLYCLNTSQGFGYTRGCGLLVDFEGNDRYTAEDDKIDNPSAQTPEHNSSLAQGVGFGKRADYLDGHSWAGGVGILCDGHGNDRYSAGLFAQGCAYWFAVGMLLDGAGDDIYRGVWYVQGSGAHFGVGYLDDFAGNDSYTASHNMAIGAGHDFTVGYFNERGGNDVYTAPNLSLGGGNANGIGVFHDHYGDDQYITDGGITLGRATASDRGQRKYLRVFGLFVDGQGQDSYREPWAANDSTWRGPRSTPEAHADMEIGVGIDR